MIHTLAKIRRVKVLVVHYYREQNGMLSTEAIRETLIVSVEIKTSGDSIHIWPYKSKVAFKTNSGADRGVLFRRPATQVASIACDEDVCKERTPNFKMNVLILIGKHTSISIWTAKLTTSIWRQRPLGKVWQAFHRTDKEDGERASYAMDVTRHNETRGIAVSVPTRHFSGLSGLYVVEITKHVIDTPTVRVLSSISRWVAISGY